MARTVVQINTFKIKVDKLSYQVRGTFRIVQCTRRESCFDGICVYQIV